MTIIDSFEQWRTIIETIEPDGCLPQKIGKSFNLMVVPNLFIQCFEKIANACRILGML